MHKIVCLNTITGINTKLMNKTIFSIFISQKEKNTIFAVCKGEMAEWSIAAVLKTVEGYTSWGSNPYFSADESNKVPQLRDFIVSVLTSPLQTPSSYTSSIQHSHLALKAS